MLDMIFNNSSNEIVAVVITLQENIYINPGEMNVLQTSIALLRLAKLR